MKHLPFNVVERVEIFRVKLGLEPFDQFKAKQLARWNADKSLSYDAVQQYKQDERQCGRSTRELLYAIAEADMRSWDLLVIGYGVEGGKALHRRAQDMVDKLGLSDMNVRKSSAYQKETLVYVDHLCGRAARVCAE